MNWYLRVLRKYAVFSGRACRKEFWLFVLFNWIISLVLGLIDGVAGLVDAQSKYGILRSLYILAVLLPGVAVTVRRLHDTGRSGWWLAIFIGTPVIAVYSLMIISHLSSGLESMPRLIGAVGFVICIMFLRFMAQDSQNGQNQYGPNPKETSAQQV
jgi:uncharacterized membrane protein YhaH (DUF805 family)